MADTRLTATQGSPTLNTKYTFSFWVRRAKLTYSEAFVFDAREDGSNRFKLSFQSADKIECFNSHGGSTTFSFVTNRQFRDPAAWYHIVLAVDTTDGTAGDRFKLYVNGTRETSFASSTNPSQNDANNVINENGRAITIGAYNDGSGYSNYFDGSLAHVHFVDGIAYTPSTFGETDATSGHWTPKTSPSVTYGNNGFFLKFENSGNLDLDSSGNNKSFTTSGNLRQLQDTPTNTFANLTPLYTIEYNSAHFFTNQNNTTNENQTNWNTNPCTMEVSSGKWYFEGYGHTNGSNYVHYGITSSAKMIANATQAESEINTNSNGYAYGYYGYNGSIYYSTPSASTSASYGATFGSTDYIGIFADLDNNKLYFAKNGTLQNSGTGYDISADGKPYILATAVYNGLTNVNFGNGLFGTTALTGTTYADANGHGIFKYSPNQGGAANFDSAAKNFYAMNTKNLKEFG